ncbi:MAG: hypothetical protein ACJ8F3_03180 [Xanthobacteraceae bacterium]
MTDATAKDEVDGWVVESQRSNYSIGYWFSFIFGMLGQIVPTPPNITYTMRNRRSNERRVITLPGDHSRAQLSAALRDGETDDKRS